METDLRQTILQQEEVRLRRRRSVHASAASLTVQADHRDLDRRLAVVTAMRTLFTELRAATRAHSTGQVVAGEHNRRWRNGHG